MRWCRPRLLLCLSLLSTVACLEADLPPGSGPVDASMNAATVDMPAPEADMAPAAVDMPVDVDMPGVVEEDMRASPEPDMKQPMGDFPKPLRLASQGDPDTILLQGLVLLESGPIEGEVLIVGDSIACAASDCSGAPDASGATVIETNGIISAGLIDAHNHLAYNFLPEWVPGPGKSFTNRYQWADDPDYEEHVLPYTANRSRNSHFCPGARWGELRSLIHGTTTVQGQSFDRTCTDGGVRNADHDHGLQHDHMRTTISSPRDIDDSGAESYLASFAMSSDRVTRFAVHMAEGYADDNIELEFDSFAGRDERQNRHMGLSLLFMGTAVLIHSVGVTDEHLLEILMTDSKIVWSPSSNLTLYNRTADINRILELGIPTAIGPDWTLSGEDDMLAELDFAWGWARDNGVMRVTPETLHRMATSDGAEVVGLGEFIGKIEPGARADLVVFTRHDEGSAYEQVVTSRPDDVRLVFIDGKAHYGRASVEDAVAVRDDCEPMNVCGAEQFVCAKYSNSDEYGSVETLRGMLVDILEGTGFPDDEQYGRGDELLELFDCSR